ncbi:hypothetical protein K5P26_05265 [Sphingopyxis sp. XHP0097]|uniref:Uncharacterized protein n=1 Tax=Sphingopyxis jiangsuensis TaxID=2871171 RepID=A0ABS7MC05_9SPHN|nr:MULTISPECIES: hypothetical protein [Sphingopyxis]MBL0767791.1 hypothetical protein [Sphingopyxis lutea]MBY4636547.1 hypothetical protein [Sphingopyxis jiangsuensis]
MTKKTKKPEALNDAALDNVTGGIGLLLPAVQKVREAAASEEDDKVIIAAGPGGGPHVKVFDGSTGG